MGSKIKLIGARKMAQKIQLEKMKKICDKYHETWYERPPS